MQPVAFGPPAVTFESSIDAKKEQSPLSSLDAISFGSVSSFPLSKSPCCAKSPTQGNYDCQRGALEKSQQKIFDFSGSAVTLLGEQDLSRLMLVRWARTAASHRHIIEPNVCCA
jgi:hypothetical protein